MREAMLIPSYRRRATPLHATRAGVGALYCLAPLACALVVDHPLVLGALALAVALAGIASGCGRAMASTARVAVVLALLTLVVNALVVRDGLTVIARLGELPPFGQLDITLEAVVSGAVLGLRSGVVLLAVALFVAAVDPDQVLALFRRVSYRSALTASLATRMVPVLAADARRLDEAQRCRPDAGLQRTRRVRLAAHGAIVRAVVVGALDRGLDVAATLEVRGYGSARQRPASVRKPLSRHDLAFGASAIGVLALVVGARLAGHASFAAYPTVSIPTTATDALLAVAVVLVYLAPHLDRRGLSR